MRPGASLFLGLVLDFSTSGLVCVVLFCVLAVDAER
jgi:hypothetical protein